jgi:thiosulfate dehydrogenase
MKAVLTLALMAASAWAAEPLPAINLIGRPVPEINNLPEGPFRSLVVQGHELSTRTFALIGPEVKNPRKRYEPRGIHSSMFGSIGGSTQRIPRAV